MDQGGLFSYIAPEARVPANHPLRKIRELVRDVLGELNRSLGRLYASNERRREETTATEERAGNLDAIGSYRLRTRRTSRSSQRIVPGGRLNSRISCRTAIRTALSRSD